MVCLHKIFTIMDQHEDASVVSTTSPDALQKTESLFLPAIQSQFVTHSVHGQMTVLTDISHFCPYCANCKHGNFTLIN